MLQRRWHSRLGHAQKQINCAPQLWAMQSPPFGAEWYKHICPYPQLTFHLSAWKFKWMTIIGKGQKKTPLSIQTNSSILLLWTLPRFQLPPFLVNSTYLPPPELKASPSSGCDQRPCACLCLLAEDQPISFSMAGEALLPVTVYKTLVPSSQSCSVFVLASTSTITTPVSTVLVA